MNSIKKIFICTLMLLCLLPCVGAKVKQYKLKVVAQYPHSPSSYTQGLFFYNNQLFETTGQYGESTLQIVDIKTGQALKCFNFSKKYFVEGSVVLDNKLYILTWQNNVAFVYDATTLKYIKTYSYPREGWGLTTNGKDLISSDGSSTLFYLSPTFQTIKTVPVKLNGRSINELNELEYIKGKIWANVYTSDLIVIINPITGDVEATVDCSNLLPTNLRDSKTDVLNGIAYNPQDDKIYLTGKYWKRLYEVQLVEK